MNGDGFNLSPEQMLGVLSALHILGLIAVATIIVFYVKNQIAYLEIHLRQFFAEHYVQRDEIVEKIGQEVKKHIDPLAARVAKLANEKQTPD